MNYRDWTGNIQAAGRQICWPLLLFLCLLLQVKQAGKFAAIVLLFAWLWKTRKAQLKWKADIPPFYYWILPLTVAGWLSSGYLFHTRYALVFAAGCTSWMLCLGAAWAMRFFAANYSKQVLENTIALYLLLNIAVALLQLLAIVHETGALNPYRYQGDHQKYFIQTGDYIRGISFDTSNTNAAINAMGAIWCLYRKKAVLFWLCMCALLLTGSNFCNIALLLVFTVVFLFGRDAGKRSLVMTSLLLFAVFMIKVSPQNSRYIKKTVGFWLYKKDITAAPPLLKLPPLKERPDSLLNNEERKEKTAMLYLDSMARIRTRLDTAFGKPRFTPALAQPDIHSAPYQHVEDTPFIKRNMLHFIAANRQTLPLAGQSELRHDQPGKIIAARQTIGYLNQHPWRWLLGNGTGNFSSRLAFRATGLGLAGSYPARWSWIHPAFLQNHLDVFLYFFAARAEMNSVINSPDSVYDQLLGEYGLAGLAAFAAGYLWFFFKRRRQLSYGLALLGFVLLLFTVSYWFEQLSVVPLLELLLWTDLAGQPATKGGDHG